MRNRILITFLIVFWLLTFSGCSINEYDVVGQWTESDLTCDVAEKDNCGIILFQSDGTVNFSNIPSDFFTSRLSANVDEPEIRFSGKWEIEHSNDPLDLGTVKIFVDSNDFFSRGFSFTMYMLYGNENLTLGLPDDVHLTFKKSK
jgi:hypothetical protein